MLWGVKGGSGEILYWEKGRGYFEVMTLSRRISREKSVFQQLLEL
jgi:hypothetical protein